MPKKIQIVLALDNEKEFTQGFRTATAAVKSNREETKLLKEMYSGAQNTIEALTKKHSALEKTLESLKRKQEAAKAGLENANKAYEKQADALAGLEAKLAAAQKEVKRFSDAGDKSSDGYQKAVAELNKYKEAVASQNTNLLKAEERVKSWMGKVSTSNKELRTAESELRKTDQYLDEANKSADGCAKSIDKMGKETKEAASDMKEAGSSARGFSDVLKGFVAGDMITTALRGVADAAKDAAKYVVDVGSSFEAAMSKVEALSGATGKELDAIKEKAEMIGRTTQFSATQVAEGFSYMALAGWDAEKSLSAIDGVVNLAIASQTDLAQASDMVTDYLSAFGLEAEYAGKMADEMAYAQAHSNTSVTQLGDAFKNSAANMNAANQSMETTTAFLEALANQGTKGSEAGTQLAAVMRDITSKMKDGKIAIGETTVSVMDAEGNFRDLVDIMSDVEAATAGMGSAQKASELQSTFTARSIKAVNQILNEGVDSIRGYKTELENSDGAAAKMAATMENNLQGSFKSLKSATEGLGIAIFEGISGPLKGGIDIVTSGINGLTDVLKGTESEAKAVADNVKKSKSELESVMKTAATDRADYEGQAAKIDLLVSQIFNLNDMEEKSEGQQYRLKAACEALGEYVPELSKLYDDQTGKITLTREEVEKLTTAYKEQMVQDRILAQQQELLNAQTDAGISLELAKGQLENLKDTYEVWQKFIDNASMAQADAGLGVYDSAKYIAQQTALLDEALADGRISIEGYNAALGYLSETELGLGQAIEFAAGERDKYDYSGTEKDVAALQKTYDDCTKAIDENTAAGEKYLEGLHEQEEGSENTAQAKDHDTVATFSLKEANEDLAESQEELVDSTDDLAESTDENTQTQDDAAKMAEILKKKREEEAKAAEEAAKAEEAAAERVEKAYDKAQESVSKSFQTIYDNAKKSLSFDFLSDTFSGGVDETVEQLIANSEEQLKALEEYESNLRIVSEHIGKEIAPEFMQYLQGMGTNGANILRHIAVTFEQDNGSELVKEWSDNYVESLDVTDRTAAVMAGNEFAIEAGLGNLAKSTEAEWSKLSETLGEAQWDGITDGLLQSIKDAVVVARTVGSEIPDGLAEGIKSGEITAQNALDMLNSSIAGTFDGLVEIAENQGITIPQEITAGIEQGGQDAIDAYNNLLSLLSTADTTAETEAEDKGKSVGTKYGTGIANSTDTASTSAESLKTAASGALAGTDEFEAAGEGAGTAFAKGIQSKEQTVTLAAKFVANHAKSGVDDLYPNFQSAGVYMDMGLASGINQGSSMVSMAMRNVAISALNAAKAELVIQSPSKRFQNEVGKMIPAGMAFGIKLNSKLAESESTNLSSRVYSAATKWLSKYKDAHEVSYADEKYYWSKVQALVDEESAAYTKAIEKMHNADAALMITTSKLSGEDARAIANNFGVSIYDAKGDGEKVIKDLDDYYAEIVSAAKQHNSNMEVVREYSLEEELAYWQTVQSRIKTGTQAWYDATKQLKTVKENIKKAAEEAAKEARQAAEDARKAYEEAQQNIYDSTSKNLEHMQILGDVSLKTQLAYWKQAQKKLEEGSELWYQATKNIRDLNEQIAEESKNKAEQFYQDIFDNAAKNLERMQILGEVSAEEQLRVWQGVKAQMVENSDLWWEAQRNISEIEKSRMEDTLTKQRTILSTYKQYYKLSERGEMDYWNTVRQMYQEGTADRIAADAEYYSAAQTYYDKLKDLDEQYESDRKSINERLKKDVEDVTKTYTDAVKTREQSIISSMNLFEEWDSEGYSGDKLLENLRSQVEGLAAWEKDIQDLKNRGILSSDLMDYLTEQGPNQAANIYGLLGMSDSELEEYNNLYTKKVQLAHEQSVRENHELLTETNEQIKALRTDALEELRLLNADYLSERTEMSAELSSNLQAMAKRAAKVTAAYAQEWITEFSGETSALETYSSRVQSIISEKLGADGGFLKEDMEKIGMDGLDALLNSMTDREKIAESAKSMMEILKEEISLAALSEGVKYDALMGRAGTMNTASFGVINAALATAATVPTVSVTNDNTGLVNTMAAMVQTIQRIAGTIENMQVVMDTGALVGQIQQPMSQANAAAQLQYQGGRL